MEPTLRETIIVMSPMIALWTSAVFAALLTTFWRGNSWYDAMFRTVFVLQMCMCLLGIVSMSIVD